VVKRMTSIQGQIIRCSCGTEMEVSLFTGHKCKLPEPTIEQMIEEMQEGNFMYDGYEWWAWTNPTPTNYYTHNSSLLIATRALYEKWKAGQ